MLSLTKRIMLIIEPKNRNKLTLILTLLFLCGIFEMISIGAFLPVLTLLAGNNTVKFSFLTTLFQHASKNEMLCYSMLAILALYLCKTVFIGYVNYFQNTFIFNLKSSISERLYDGYLKQSYSFHINTNSSVLLRNIVEEMNQFIFTLQAILGFVSEFLVISGLSILLIILEPKGTLMAGFILTCFVFLFRAVTKNKISTWGELRQDYYRWINQQILQGLGCIKEIKILGREDFLVQQFKSISQLNIGLNIKSNTLQQFPRLYLEFLSVFAVSGFVFEMVAEHKEINTLLTSLGIFAVASFRMIPSFTKILSHIQSIEFGKSAINLLYKEFIGLQPETTLQDPTPDLSIKQTLTLKNIEFSYAESAIKTIENCSVEFHKGEIIGLIGASGSGKSTFIDILTGLLVPTKGAVLVDGQPIHTNIMGWQKQIGYVPQSIYFNDDTIKHNIAFGIREDLIDNDTIEKLIALLHLSEMIDEQVAGLNTIVGERGVKLSGGQKQRIGIARALYHDPAILILDEATNAMDSELEEKIINAIATVKSKRLILIITHRLSGLKHCDRIFKMEKGTLLEYNT